MKRNALQLEDTQTECKYLYGQLPNSGAQDTTFKSMIQMIQFYWHTKTMSLQKRCNMSNTPLIVTIQTIQTIPVRNSRLNQIKGAEQKQYNNLINILITIFLSLVIQTKISGASSTTQR